ncbi:hypothetical protein F6X40_23790 [Paraburkholderia sp. UCT31]|uniref:hypothetical protein n=1 Tax=Paraburkholderia sp. UCT31 TaxID=2615209 RepID=UPI0016565841|nr:hypothetical protein [Paraburkholderia sp. UCT31]MBC8739739.1 hypothetical protein [Paraburkholderia sp. UCT31]
MDMEQTLRGIATGVRSWAEEYARSHPEQPFDLDLGGMCGIASARIHRLCETAGLEPLLHVSANDSHMFVTCAGFLVDVTATQFREASPVIVRPYANAPSEPDYWRTGRTYASVSEAKSYQVDADWPFEQLILSHVEPAAVM